MSLKNRLLTICVVLALGVVVIAAPDDGASAATSNGWTTTGSVSGTQVARGSSVTVTISVVSSTELQRADRPRDLQRVHEVVSAILGWAIVHAQRSRVSSPQRGPCRRTRRRPRMLSRSGVFGAGWNGLAHWNDNAARITVTVAGATTTTSPQPSTTSTEATTTTAKPTTTTAKPTTTTQAPRRRRRRRPRRPGRRRRRRRRRRRPSRRRRRRRPRRPRRRRRRRRPPTTTQATTTTAKPTTTTQATTTTTQAPTTTATGAHGSLLDSASGRCLAHGRSVRGASPTDGRAPPDQQRAEPHQGRGRQRAGTGDRQLAGPPTRSSNGPRAVGHRRGHRARPESRRNGGSRDAAGDLTTDQNACYPTLRTGSGQCPESIGLGQVRYQYHPLAFTNGTPWCSPPSTSTTRTRSGAAATRASSRG